MSAIVKYVVVCLFIVLLSSATLAQHLSLPAIFGSHMVLQRGTHPPIWGKSKSDALVTLRINKQRIQTYADVNGLWKTTLSELNVGKIYTLSIESAGEEIVFNDVLAGDVYYAGGQSNMDYELYRATGGEQEIELANIDNIRLFKVARQVACKPQFDFSSVKDSSSVTQWTTCTPKTARDFSAVAYWFAKKINQKEHIPIGIIQVAWTGTTIETHMSLPANKSLPYHKELLATMEKECCQRSDVGKKDVPPVLPGSIFNAMIHPLIPYGIKGFIWYQGEQNANYPYRYREQLVTFINDMRIRWQQGYLPFYFVQMPGMGKKPEKPVADFWSILRESQMLALHLTNTGMVVSHNLDENDLHPKNKKLIGERLAMLALKNDYGKNQLSESPIYKSYTINKDTIEITFHHAESGLRFKGDIKGFAIAGDDKVFHWANAIIDDGFVLKVFCDRVKKPLAVRYAWGENPDFSLFNTEGLPASPFRTDDWQLTPDGWWEY